MHGVKKQCHQHVFRTDGFVGSVSLVNESSYRFYFNVHKWPALFKTKEVGNGFNEELFNIELQESLELARMPPLVM